MGRWQRYWHGDGGCIAAAFVRVAIASSVLLTLTRLADQPLIKSPALYRPIGPWMLLGGSPPPDSLIDALWLIAWISSAAMLIGLFTRAATVVSFVATCSLAALSQSHLATWSHSYNVTLAAQLAFFGARGGDVLAIDAVVAKLRNATRAPRPTDYLWSVRLVQLAVAVMFASAVVHKLALGGPGLRWALSDNLRNHLMVRYDLAGLERPPLVDWLLEDVWRYRTAAIANLVAQLIPICAVMLVRRPWLRGLCGAVFAIEVVGLGLVMSLWNLHWLPLVAVFIDWDRLNDWLTKSSQPDGSPTTVRSLPKRVWVIVFVIYSLVTAFVPTLGQRLNTYPFTSYPMFATVRAPEPYDHHLPYAIVGDAFEVTSPFVIPQDVQRWFDYDHRGFVDLDPADLERHMRALIGEAQERFPELAITSIRHRAVIFEAPAYPAPARFQRFPIAVTAEVFDDGRYRSALGRVVDDKTLVLGGGVEIPSSAPLYMYRERPVRFSVAAKREGDRYVGELAHGRLYVVEVGEVTWVVARR